MSSLSRSKRSLLFMSQTIRDKQLEMFVWFILAFEDQYRPECLVYHLKLCQPWPTKKKVFILFLHNLLKMTNKKKKSSESVSPLSPNTAIILLSRNPILSERCVVLVRLNWVSEYVCVSWLLTDRLTLCFHAYKTDQFHHSGSGRSWRETRYFFEPRKPYKDHSNAAFVSCGRFRTSLENKELVLVSLLILLN